MNSEIHQGKYSLIGIIRKHLDGWRKENQWSRETMAGEIFKAHVCIDGPLNSGIELENKSDVFETMKINAQRIYRWLDDVTKDINLMPLNFLPTILATMPADVRIRCVNEILLPLDLACRPVMKSVKTKVDINHLHTLIRESSEAQESVIDLLDGASHAELMKARNELQQSIDAATEIMAVVEHTLSIGKAA